MAIYALGDLVPDVHPDAYVHPDATVIGSVTLGAHASVWPGAVIRGDDAPITVGARTSIQDGSVIHTTREFPTQVGEVCVIGHIVHLEGCIIQDHALVGNGSVVLHGAVVESHALVGSNAVVPNGMVVPTGAMALGVPAKLREGTVGVGDFDEAAASYAARADTYRRELRRLD
jgi:carbonic anhydrase/acetyltransferase-like protein (isoleucine patch superfamily)